MIIINAETVEEVLTPDVQLELIEKAFRITQDPEAHQNPLRTMMRLMGGDNIMGMMPGAIADGNIFGIKLVNIFHGNAAKGLSSHMGVMPLFDGETGAVKAIIDTAKLTAIRTAAASAFASKILARPQSRTLGIIGTGEQAHSHIKALCHTFPIDKIVIAGSSHQKAVRFANVMTHAHNIEAIPVLNGGQVAQLSDIICTVTSSKSPVLRADWLRPGQHVNAVGACSFDQMEISPDCIEKCHYYTDYLPSLRAEAGEFVAHSSKDTKAEDHVNGELGAVVCGTAKGRESDQDITLFRSLGIAVEDLVFAQYLYEVCREKDMGQHVKF